MQMNMQMDMGAGAQPVVAAPAGFDSDTAMAPGDGWWNFNPIADRVTLIGTPADDFQKMYALGQEGASGLRLYFKQLLGDTYFQWSATSMAGLPGLTSEAGAEALRFTDADSAGDVDSELFSRLASATAFTYVLVIKTSSAGAIGLFEHKEDFGFRFLVARMQADGTVRVTDPAGTDVLTSEATIDDGEPHLVTIRLAGGMLYLGIDGVEVSATWANINATALGRVLHLFQESTAGQFIGTWGFLAFNPTTGAPANLADIVDGLKARYGIA